MSSSGGEDLLGATCFRLGFLGARITQEFSESIEHIGLTHKQVGLLAAVSAGLARSQRDIATVLGVAPSLVVSLVDQLVGISAVTRVRSDRDRRVQTVALTSIGEELLAASVVIAEQMDQQLHDRLSPEGRSALGIVLAELGTDLHGSR